MEPNGHEAVSHQFSAEMLRPWPLQVEATAATSNQSLPQDSGSNASLSGRESHEGRATIAEVHLADWVILPAIDGKDVEPAPR